MTDDDLRTMLERRVAGAESLAETLAERAEAVAARTELSGVRPRRLPGDQSRPAAARRPNQWVAPASLVATVVLAVGLLAVLAERSAPANPSGSGTPNALGGTASALASSPDAVDPVGPWGSLTWQRAGTSQPPWSAWGGQRYLVDVVAWGDGVVAVGYDFEDRRATGRIWRSSDGLDWHEMSVDERFDGVGFEAVFALDDRLVARGRLRGADVTPGEEGRAVAFESTDGASWTAITTEGGPWAATGELRLVAGGGQILALDTGSGRLWRTADGATWTSVSLAETFPGTRIATIAWTGEGWLAGGVAGDPADNYWNGFGAIWGSEDAISWSPATIDAPHSSIGAFVTGRDGVVAVGASTGFGGAIILTPPMWRSGDGSTWSRATLDGTRLQVVSDGDRFIAIDLGKGTALAVSESFDAETWRPVEIRALGQFDPDDPGTLDGLRFDGQFERVIVTRRGIWATDGQVLEDVQGIQTEVDVRWFGEPGIAAGSATFPPRPLPEDNDVRCPGSEPCGP